MQEAILVRVIISTALVIVIVTVGCLPEDEKQRIYLEWPNSELKSNGHYYAPLDLIQIDFPTSGVLTVIKLVVLLQQNNLLSQVEFDYSSCTTFSGTFACNWMVHFDYFIMSLSSHYLPSYSHRKQPNSIFSLCLHLLHCKNNTSVDFLTNWHMSWQLWKTEKSMKWWNF